MPNRLLLAALAAGLSTPALASSGLFCAAAGGSAEIGMTIGTAGGLALVGAHMRAGDARWVTDPAYGEGTVFTIGQRFADSGGLKADFFDEIVNERIAELRLSRAVEGGTVIFAGTLRIVGTGAWAVSCEER